MVVSICIYQQYVDNLISFLTFSSGKRKSSILQVFDSCFWQPATVCGSWFRHSHEIKSWLLSICILYCQNSPQSVIFSQHLFSDPRRLTGWQSHWNRLQTLDSTPVSHWKSWHNL